MCTLLQKGTNKHTIIYRYTCLSVTLWLSVRQYPITVKTAEPIGPKLCTYAVLGGGGGSSLLSNQCSVKCLVTIQNQQKLQSQLYLSYELIIGDSSEISAKCSIRKCGGRYSHNLYFQRFFKYFLLKNYILYFFVIFNE